MFISKVNFETESVEEIEKLRQCLDRPLILSQKIEKKMSQKGKITEYSQRKT